MLVIKFKTMLVRKSECSYRLRFQLNFSFLPGLSWATLSDICHGNSMCCWSVTAIVKRINIFTRLLLQSRYKTLHLVNIRNVEKRFNSRSQPLSLSPAPAGGRALIVIWKVNWITTRQCQSGAGKHDSAILLMVATSTTFQPSSDSDLLLSTD